MTYKCREKPGKGTYVCKNCGATKVFDDTTDTLAPCSKCLEHSYTEGGSIFNLRTELGANLKWAKNEINNIRNSLIRIDFGTLIKNDNYAEVSLDFKIDLYNDYKGFFIRESSLSFLLMMII